MTPGTDNGNAMMRADRSPQQKWHDMSEENDRYVRERRIVESSFLDFARWVDDGGKP